MQLFLIASRDQLIEQLHREISNLKEELKNFKAEVNRNTYTFYGIPNGVLQSAWDGGKFAGVSVGGQNDTQRRVWLVRVGFKYYHLKPLRNLKCHINMHKQRSKRSGLQLYQILEAKSKLASQFLVSAA